MPAVLIPGRKKWSTPLTDAKYQLRRAQNIIGDLQVVLKGDIAVGIFSQANDGRRHTAVSTFQAYHDHKTLGDIVERFIPNTEGVGVYLIVPPPDAYLQNLPPEGFGINRTHHLKVFNEREQLKAQVLDLTEQLGKSRILAEIESEGADKTAENCLSWMHKANNLESENEQLKSKLRKIQGILIVP